MFLHFPLYKEKIYSEQLISLTTDQVKLFVQTNFGTKSLSRCRKFTILMESLELKWKYFGTSDVMLGTQWKN